MKLLSAFFASLTICSILEPLNDITTKQALLRGQVWQPNFPKRISRSKRDLIGFNRQTNNIFSHQRNHSGRTGMKQSHLCHLRVVGCDPFLFNNIKETISKQWCKILSSRKGEQFELWCSRKKNKQYWIGLDIWNSNAYVGLYAEVNIHRILDDHGFYHINYISGPEQACEELMHLETRLGKGFF